MILPDVNVWFMLIATGFAWIHARYRQWLEENTPQRSAIRHKNDHVLSGFLRVVTHPRVFTPPSPLRIALDFVGQIRSQLQYVASLRPVPVTQQIFSEVSANHFLPPAI